MKTALLIILSFYLFLGYTNGQEYYYNFDNGDVKYWDDWISIEFDDSGIWQIGKPHKQDWDSAFTGKYVLITDTLKMLYKPAKASFTVKIKRPWWMNCLTGYDITMAHKYDLPKGKAGAYIEASYDKGASWVHIKNDTLPCYYLPEYGQICNEPFIKSLFYADTLNGMPVASGERKLWGDATNHNIYNEIGKLYEVDTVAAKIYDIWLRFTYENTDTIPHKGWMIDSLRITTNYWCEFLNISEAHKNTSSIYPNPVLGESVLCFNNPNATEVALVIYNLQGKNVFSAETCSQHFIINKSSIKKGAYIYKLVKNNSVFANGKFIVE